MKRVLLVLVLFGSFGYQQYQINVLKQNLDLTMEVLIRTTQAAVGHDGSY
jgi:predicted Zn-dependent peptidase